MIVSLYHLKKNKSPSYKYKNTFEEKYLPQLVFKACDLISDYSSTRPSFSRDLNLFTIHTLYSIYTLSLHVNTPFINVRVMLHV